MRISDWSSDVCSSDLERFSTGVTEGWQATWIAADKGWPVHIAESRKGADNPGPKVMPLFRRGFTVGKPVRHAVISISGLGHYQLSNTGRTTTARTEERRVGKARGSTGRSRGAD